MESPTKEVTESICDDNGFEIAVTYDIEVSESQMEEGHGVHEVGSLVYIELKKVEIVFTDSSINILPLLNTKHLEFIKSKLNQP